MTQFWGRLWKKMSHLVKKKKALALLSFPIGAWYVSLKSRLPQKFPREAFTKQDVLNDPCTTAPNSDMSVSLNEVRS